MRWSNLFIPTLRDVPADAEVASHKLLLRAGYIRQLGSGIYSLLPLAKRSINKIEQIVREEMNQIGGQEFDLPALNPDDIWRESGRWEEMGENMFRLKDRGGRDLCLGMTHEEVFTSIARDELRSYRELPQIWYQIQVKFRDEPRPKSGLLRVRQFTMKDSYSFDIDFDGLDKNYDLHDTAYRKIFDRCGLRYMAVKAASGAMGGSESQEFVVYSDAGEDWIVSCEECGYAANLETANSHLSEITDSETDASPKEIHTPNQKTIEEVSNFLNLPTTSHIKSLVLIAENKPYLVLLRGDHQLNETKLASVLGTEAFRPGTPEEIRQLLGADPGSLGPVGVSKLPILADQALQGRKNLICGANKDDFHLKNVTPGKDFTSEYVDLRSVTEGEPCAECRNPLRVAKAIEIGHIFKLGLKYSQSMGATVLDQNGDEQPIVMGSYGIGIGRLLATAVELYNDKDGMILPPSIAPFQVILTLLRPDDPEHLGFAEKLYKDLNNRGIDCLLDDRKERPGVKFKDADLVGIPVRVTFGKKLTEGKVEIFRRFDKDLQVVELESAVQVIEEILNSYPI